MENDPYGSFTAEGTGLLYSFNARQKALAIYRTGGKAPLHYQELSAAFASDAALYCQLFEKTSQLKALKYSDKKLIDLTLTLHDNRLHAILQRTAQISALSFLLKKEDFQTFTESISSVSSLRRLTIEKKPLNGHSVHSFSVEADTKRGHIIHSRSLTLHGALSYLADSIIQNIIAREFGYGSHEGAQTLLDTSRLIMTLSFIINPGFDPIRKLNCAQFQFFSPATNTHKNT